MFELIINILLFIFFGYTFFTHVLEAAVPAKVANNPYALQPDVWPKAIIILLEICLIVNIIQIIKKNKGKPEFTLGAFIGSIPAFLKSKLFFGIVIMVVASFILDTVGFIVTSLFILFFYGLLIGEKNIVRLLIASVCITMVLYIVFSGMLSVIAVVLGEYTVASLLGRMNLQVALYQLGQSNSQISTAMSLLALLFGAVLLVALDLISDAMRKSREGK